jgi:hypothetical protein
MHKQQEQMILKSLKQIADNIEKTDNFLHSVSGASSKMRSAKWEILKVVDLVKSANREVMEEGEEITK